MPKDFICKTSEDLTFCVFDKIYFVTHGCQNLSPNFNIHLWRHFFRHVTTLNMLNTWLFFIKNIFLDLFQLLKIFLNFFIILKLLHPVLHKKLIVTKSIVDFLFGFIHVGLLPMLNIFKLLLKFISVFF